MKNEKLSTSLTNLISASKNYSFSTSLYLNMFISKIYFRLFCATDGVCPIPLNIPFNGDLTIHVSHAPVGLSFHAHVRILMLIDNLF